jgi:hypothetical protein
LEVPKAERGNVQALLLADLDGTRSPTQREFESSNGQNTLNLPYSSALKGEMGVIFDEGVECKRVLLAISSVDQLRFVHRRKDMME